MMASRGKASPPEAYGQYFAWGYTTAYSWTGSAWSPSITFNATGFSDYTTHTYADMAAAKWGTGWSVPTKADWENLYSSSYTSIKKVTTGTSGIKVTGIGDYAQNSIFLPAAGYGADSNQSNAGVKYFYWSSVQQGNDRAYAFTRGGGSGVGAANKYLGCSVRPVYTSL